MNQKTPKSIEPYGGGVLHDLAMRIKLILRLMGDRRVNILLKALPLASLAYLILPEGLAAFPLITPVDDALVIWLGLYLFVELCPDDVVEEHLQALRRVIPGEWRDAPPNEPVLDAEYKDAASDSGLIADRADEQAGGWENGR